MYGLLATLFQAITNETACEIINMSQESLDPLPELLIETSHLIVIPCVFLPVSRIRCSLVYCLGGRF